MDLAYKNNLIIWINGYLNSIKANGIDLDDPIAVEEYCIWLTRLLGGLREYQSKYLIKD